MSFRVRIAALALLMAGGLVAQNTGRISGSVVDASGSPVPAVAVNLFVPGGSSPVVTTTTGADGLYRFVGVQPIAYDLSVEVKGFRKEIIRGIKVDAGLELAVKPIKLEVSSVAESIEVTAESATIQTANAEIASVVTNAQLTKLPSLNRSPLAFLSIQVGVGGNGRGTTTINGLRPSFANVTIDGVNIQDNFIRTNTLDFQPNMLQLDQVAEFSLSTSNSNPSNGNGAAQVSFQTPSGTNEIHGTLLWFNRNNAVSANTWFNNRNGVARPFLNQNQAGGSIGGPIKKDKLFYYANYEATRLRQQTAATRTILTAPARNGIFTYRDVNGALQSVNVLQAAGGLQADATMRTILGNVPGPDKINRTDIGDGLNTAGYAFNVRNNRTRDNITGKLNFIPTPKHAFAVTYIWNRDIIDRADLSNDYSLVPKVTNDNSTPLLSTSYRWNPNATFTNEARGGFNIAPAVFGTNENFGNAIYTLPLIGNPVNTFRAQGRYVDTFNFQDNASWFKGKHSFTFGYQGQVIKANPFNDAGNLPVYAMGISAANTMGLTGAQLPGIRATDVALANNLLTLHAGFISGATQTFNVTSRDSGFVPGATQSRNFRQWNHAFYFNDSWRLKPSLTVTMGLRWEYYTPVDEVNGVSLLPVLQNNNPIQTLLSNSTLNFAGSTVGRPWYNRDLNNFGPNIGIAWQPFNDGGKTVVRAGYSVNFPNDEFIRSIDNNVNTNAGLASTVGLTNLVARAAAPPTVPTPTFRVPRTFQDNYRLDPQSAFGMPDPNLRTPYVQQWSLGVQREIMSGVLEVRYVGNRQNKQFRAFDYNQVVISQNGFLPEFLKAYNNGNLARTATGTFNPAYNPAIPGSVALPFFDALPSQGLLTNATIRNLIETGQVGELGAIYQINALNGNVNFFRNPFALGTNMMTNYSNASYHAGQIDYTRRFKNGLQWQANYTYSKVLSDAAGDAQARFEAFLDMDNAKIERSRTPFDLTHSFKVNAFYELPVGKGKAIELSNGFLDRVLGGWGISGLMTWNSGAPFSINSGRGTFNRAARSGVNTATTNLTKSQLDELFEVRMTGNGPYFVGASAIGADGRGASADGRAPFTGQAFFHPGPGTLGALQRRWFDGPSFWNTDFRIIKSTTIRERHRLEFAADFFNLTNTVSFFLGDQTLDSTNFGRITGTNSGRRIVQFGLTYRF